MRSPALRAAFLAVLTTLSTARAQDADLDFLQQLTETRSFRLGRPTAVQVTPDGSAVLFLRSLARNPEMRLYAMDVASGQVRELITPEQVLAGAAESLSAEEKAQRERRRMSGRGFTNYDLSRDGKQVLVSISGRALVVPIAGGAPKLVAGPSKKSEAKGEAIFDPKLSPDGQSVSFVRGAELWVAPVAGGMERQLTHGATAQVTHGQAEFVAQEELSRFSGYWWSPDSKSLVFEEVDSSGMEKLYFGDPAHPEIPVAATPYPRPGKANAKTRFGIVPAAGGRQLWIDPGKFEYVVDVSWQEGAPLTMQLLSRDQRDLSLVAIDPKTGKAKELLHEHDDAWVNAGERDYKWLKDGSGFLWASERGGAWQLELHRGVDIQQLTPLEWGFAGLVALAPDGKSVVVRRAQEPVEGQLWSIPFGGEAQAITQGPELHTGVYARESPVHVISSQPFEGPGRAQVFRADGSIAGELPSVSAPLPFTVKLDIGKVGSGAGFWTAIIRPHDFDASKRYPVIEMIYGGPHVNTVRPVAEAYVSDQFVADHGYIVVHIDGRGTPGRGRAWERAILEKLAAVPIEDHIVALLALSAKEPAMDMSRVGIMGHSFGGFMAALSVERRSDVYKAAVAGAPVVDWMNYDTAYTERYLGVPAPAGHSDAYGANGLVPYVGSLKSPLMIVHGTADDNVHFEESLTLSDALFRAGKPFDLLPQVGQTHMFYQPALQVRYWQRIFAFFKEHL